MATTHNTGSGSWTEKNTWTPASVPDKYTKVLLDFGGATVTLTGKGSASYLFIGDQNTLKLTGGSLSAKDIDITAGGSLLLENGSSVLPPDINYSGTIANAGNIALSSTGGPTKLAASSLTTILDISDRRYAFKGGTLSLSDSAGNVIVGVALMTDSRVNPVTLTNVNNTIQGAGRLGAGTSNIVNEAKVGTGRDTGEHARGEIRATGINNALEIELGATNTLTNGGLIEASGKAGLKIFGAGVGSKIKNTGEIKVDAGSKLSIAHVNMTNTATGEVRTIGGSLDLSFVTMANAGKIEALHGKLKLWDVDLNNVGGQIAVRQKGGELELQDGTKIKGGKLEMEAGTALVVTRSFIGNDPVVMTDTSVNNLGTLEIYGGASLIVTGNTAFNIGGTLTVRSNASLNVSGPFNIGGNVTNAGKIQFKSPLTLQGKHTVSFAAGSSMSGIGATLTNVDDTISGTGTIHVGNLTNQLGGTIEGDLKLNVATKLTNAGKLNGADIKTAELVNTGTMLNDKIVATTVVNQGTISFSTFDVPFGSAIKNDSTGRIESSSFGHTTVTNLGSIGTSSLSGGKVTFAGTELHGGSLDTNGNGVIRTVASPHLTFLDPDKIASGTTFVIENGSNVQLFNGTAKPLVLDKVSITLAGTTQQTRLDLNSGNFTLQGGKVTLSDSANNRLSFTNTLTNVNDTISGAGEITATADKKTTATLINQAGGTIEANGKNALTIDLARITNDGRLEADGATLKIITTNAIKGSGEVVVTNGGIVDMSEAGQFLGSFHYIGRGTIQGPKVVPAGLISGFATGDTYVFGKNTAFSGELTTVWQENAANTGGTLTISSLKQAYATLQLAGIYTSTDFAATLVPLEDGKDGSHISVSFTGPLKWLNAVNGNWQVPANWGPTGLIVPGPADDALLAATGASYRVTSAQDVTVKGVGLVSDATLFIRGSRFTATNGTGASMSNAGTVWAAEGGTFMVGGTFAQTSEGRIVARGKDAIIDIAEGGAISLGQVNLLEGSVLNARNGAALLSGVTVNNQEMINVTNKTKLTLTDSKVIGSGSIMVAKGSTLALAGSSIAGKTIIDHGALEIIGDAELRGSVELDAGRINGVGAPGEAILNNYGTISGGGTMVAGLINYGTIRADVSKTIVIDSGFGTTVNRGNIFALGGGQVHLAGALDNRVSFFAEGGLGRFDAMVTNSGLMQAKGTGSVLDFKGDVANSAVVSAIDGGIVHVRGTVTQGITDELHVAGRDATVNFHAGSGISGGLVTLADDARLNAIKAGQVGLNKLTLSVDRTSAVQVDDTVLTLADVTVNSMGTIDVTGRNASLVLDESIVNGSLAVNSDRLGFYSSASLRVVGKATLNATNVHLERGAKIVSDGSAATLTNAGFIAGYGGFVGDGNLTLINDGTITSGVGGAPIEIATGDNAIVNNGVIKASDAGSKVTLRSTLDNGAAGKLQSGGGAVIAGPVNNAGLVEAAGIGHIDIQGGLTNTGKVVARSGGAVSSLATENLAKATATATGAGSVMTLGGGSSVVTNAGQITAEAGGVVTFNNGVSNLAGGQLIAKNGGQMRAFGAASGGIARINGDGSVMDFEGSLTRDTTTNAIFGNAGIGQLVLNNSLRFAGTVSGLAAGDSIDVKDVAFDTGNDFYDEDTGHLTVTDGTHTAVIQLFGQYVASDFAFASDGHGGTLVTGTPTADPAAASMMLAAHA